MTTHEAIRHTACPVCGGAGGWRASTGTPVRPTAADFTKCLYCHGSGQCPTCAASKLHPAE